MCTPRWIGTRPECLARLTAHRDLICAAAVKVYRRDQKGS